MPSDNADAELFEAVCGAKGELPSGCCDAALGMHECTRAVGHLGDHVAANTEGVLLARWREGDESPR